MTRAQSLPRKSCGRELNNRIQRICGSNYNGMEHTRVKRGIVNECCQNICLDSFVELFCRFQRAQHSNRITATNKSSVNLNVNFFSLFQICLISIAKTMLID